jgi:glycine dehydrogenase subunit 2
VAALEKIAREAETDPQVILTAPHNAPVRRLDEALAARHLNLSWSPPEQSAAGKMED